MPTPTAKNSEDIATLGKNFDTFRGSTDLSLRSIKVTGTPLLGFTVAILLALFGYVMALSQGIKGVEGQVEVVGVKVDEGAKATGGRLDRIEQALNKMVESMQRPRAEAAPAANPVAQSELGDAEPARRPREATPTRPIRFDRNSA